MTDVGRQVQNNNISRGPVVLDPADSTSNLGRPRLCRPGRVRVHRRARLATDLKELTSQPAHLPDSVRDYCAAVLSGKDRRKPRLDALLGHKAVLSQTRVTSEILHGDAGSVHRGRMTGWGHSWTHKIESSKLSDSGKIQLILNLPLMAISEVPGRPFDFR